MQAGVESFGARLVLSFECAALYKRPEHHGCPHIGQERHASPHIRH